MHRASLRSMLVPLSIAIFGALAAQSSELARVPGNAQCSESSDPVAYSKCLARQAQERSSIVHATEQRVLEAIDRWNKDDSESKRASRLFRSSQLSFEGLKVSLCEVSVISAARGPSAVALRYKCQEQLDLAWLDQLQKLIVEFGP